MRLGVLAATVLLAGVLGLAIAQPASVAKRPALTVGVKGRGTVTSSPRGIACPPKCTLTGRKGARVTLKAKAAAGWKFRRWGFACTSTKPRCRVRLTTAKAVAASFGRAPAPPPPPPPPSTPPPPPPPPPAPEGFRPGLLAGTWSGTWTVAPTTTGTATIVVTLVDTSSFTFEATLSGNVLGCPELPSFSATVTPGAGQNQWNPAGFSIQATTPGAGSASLNHDFNLRTLDGRGIPGCRADASWVLTGAFNAGYTAFNGTITTSFPNSSTGAFLSLTHSG